MSDTVSVEWEQSPTVGALFGALSKAQGMIKPATKSADNPFFKSRYADLATIMDACREPLAKNELCVLQQAFTRGNQVGVRTQLGHSSGEWTACVALVTPKDGGPQSFGSCTSYLRRYSLAAVTGVVTEDDDGEKAEGRNRDAKPPGANWGKPKNETQPADTGEVVDPGTLQDIRLAAGEKWKGRPAEARKWLNVNFGTEDAASLTKAQGAKALEMLRAA